MKLIAFTLDLEPEYAGLVNRQEIFNNPQRIEEALSFLSSFSIKITTFIVAELLESHPDIIKIFERYDCESELHSYNHDKNNKDVESEIKKAKQSYYNYFGKFPTGYRAPCGRIKNKDFFILEKQGFSYDSSIFPSYYPNPLKYLFFKRSPHYIKGSRLMEIPLTSITPLRFMLSLSYLKLLGINFYFRLFRMFGLPDFICFNMHLHDFIVCENSYKQLPAFWKLVYGRNKFSGLDFCSRFIKFIKREGYQICTMSETYQFYKKEL
jgi:hypothetical protein